MGPWDADFHGLASQISSGSVGGTSLLRFCRLIRLVRIVKVFRIKASASGAVGFQDPFGTEDWHWIR